MNRNLTRLLAAFLALVLVAVSFAGCSDEKPNVAQKKSFADVAEMETYLEDADQFWVCDVSTQGNAVYTLVWYEDRDMYIVEYTRGADQTLGEMFDDIFNELEQKGKNIPSSFTSTEIFESGQMRVAIDSVTLDPATGTATSSKSTVASVTYEFYDDDTMVYNGNTYKRTSDLSELTTSFNDSLSKFNEKKKQAFLEKYEGAASYRDVRYSPYSYLGSNFIIEGTAELDDYFNYDYYDMEMLYYCIAVTPTGGGYSDIWYIYADRYDDDELLEQLKGGTKKITIVARGQYPDAFTHNMAQLTDYFLG